MLKIRYNDSKDNKLDIEIGVDEAGRGPLLGRVYAAAVVYENPKPEDIVGIKDSKKFSSEKKILEINEKIKATAKYWEVAYCTEQEIDQHNIRKATYMAMHKAITAIINKIGKNKLDNIHILVDGSDFIPLVMYDNSCDNFVEINKTCITKGDNKYVSIAAASILAKVARDNYIKELCNKNKYLDQQYDLLNNKGYGTKAHLQAIKNYGISIYHRKSFKPCCTYSEEIAISSIDENSLNMYEFLKNPNITETDVLNHEYTNPNLVDHNIKYMHGTNALALVSSVLCCNSCLLGSEDQKIFTHTISGELNRLAKIYQWRVAVIPFNKKYMHVPNLMFHSTLLYSLSATTSNRRNMFEMFPNKLETISQQEFDNYIHICNVLASIPIIAIGIPSTKNNDVMSDFYEVATSALKITEFYIPDKYNTQDINNLQNIDKSKNINNNLIGCILQDKCPVQIFKSDFPNRFTKKHIPIDKFLTHGNR